MKIDTINPFEGTIELNWPGKQCKLLFEDNHWILVPNGKETTKRALLFEKRIGEGPKIKGYAIKGDVISALEALHSYTPASIQFIYFDAPRLNVFQDITESGYTTSTWLSLVQQSAEKARLCLKRYGFFAVHTDEKMSHYARLVLEEVFGIDHYVGTLVWQKQYGPQNDLNIPTDVFDYITVFSKAIADDLPKIGIMVRPSDLKDDGDFRGCFTDGHKGARSGSEATKFRINSSPYRWNIIDSKLPSGNFHFDPILGSIWFESVDEVGDYYITIEVEDKVGSKTTKTIDFCVREPHSSEDVYELPSRIWWLMKNDNDIVTEGDLSIIDPSPNEKVAIRGQQFSIIFKASGGTIFSMRSDAPGSNRYWEFGKRTLIEGIAKAEVSFGPKGLALPSIKKFYNRESAKKIAAVMNYLPWYDYGHTQDATQHAKSLKTSGITEGPINMMAKPQKLLGHLISLFAPNKTDLVLTIGDTNGVFASVANKMQRTFIHLIGSNQSDIEIWNNTGSLRILASLAGLDSEEVEGSDYLPDSKPTQGFVDVLRLSKSSLIKNERTGEVNNDFDANENIEDFWAGLSGAYRISDSIDAYQGIDDRIVVVVPFDQPLDNILVDRYKRRFSDKKIIIIYESSEGNLSAPTKVTLRRAPFDLI